MYRGKNENDLKASNSASSKINPTHSFKSPMEHTGVHRRSTVKALEELSGNWLVDIT